MTEEPDIAQQARKEAVNASRRFRLPFGRQTWRGTQGNWVGAGTGSSIDFQDHRDYQWGDDPRNIHWAAYARTGQLTMKMYRAELSPVVDIVIDISASMAITGRKQTAAEALLLFCLQNADHSSSPVRIHAVDGSNIIRIEPDDVRSGQWRTRLPQNKSDGTMPFIPTWGPNCMKILITDILYPGDPGPLLAQMAQSGGLSLIFAPGAAEEESLDYEGNVYLTDCETGKMRHQHVSKGIAERYRQAYANHFHLWKEACRRYKIHFSRIPCQLPLAEALTHEALKEGLIELY